MSEPGPVLERLLDARGVPEEERRRFLSPGWRNLPAAGCLPGVGEAVEAMLPFIREGRKIVVFGDYDVDGMCACAIMLRTLSALGANVAGFLPDRFREGYGMSRAALDRLFAEHPDVALVMTVDNGISSAGEVEYLKSRGVEAIVTDHHLPGDELPNCVVVDPHVKPSEGCEDLCGAGVAYFLASHLVKRAKDEAMAVPAGISGPLLVLAGLATVADVVPLVMCNRDIVKASLELFDRFAPVGLTMLKQHSFKSAKPPTSLEYGFVLSPRINAAGRMASAMDGLSLLMTNDCDRARLLASRVEGLNALRKGAEAIIVAAAERQIEKAPGKAAYTVFGEAFEGGEWTGREGESRWHTGVVGIVAGRLSEALKVPVAVVAGLHGSVRAPEGYCIRGVLQSLSGMLVRFGGHAHAGGFTLKEGAEAEFAAAFEAACAEQAQNAVACAGESSEVMWLEPREVNEDLWRAVEMLEPFGEGNPEPIFGIRGVHLKDVSVMGNEGKHLSCSFDRSLPHAVWWRHGNEVERLRALHSTVDITFSLSKDDWGLELNLESLA